MEKVDIPFLSTAELGDLIKNKEISPVEAVEAYLERIDDLDFKFNAYFTVCRKEAFKAAKAAEQAILQGDYLGPMHGIPVAAKDQFWTKGIRSTGGFYLLADFFPDEDATVIANLKRAGGIILGKTNMPELAISPDHRFSTVHNPWDLDRHTGGSSSGSAAAVSAFLCSTALGEDTSGSIRNPAGWCGLVGLRPTWGRISRYGCTPGAWSFDTIGPISRTVEDSAITLGAIAGRVPKDPYTWDTPVPDYRKALTSNIKGIQVGIITEQVETDVVEPAVRDAVVKATSVLAELGADVENVSIPLTSGAVIISTVVQNVEPPVNYRSWMKERFGEFGRVSRVSLLTGSIIPAHAYYKAQKLRSMLRSQILEALERYDVLVLPTSGRPAPRIESPPVITSKEIALGTPHLLSRPANIASAPAISLPCGFTPDDLPIGLQIMGSPRGEETVLKVAHAYEQNTPWHTVRPPNA